MPQDVHTESNILSSHVTSTTSPGWKNDFGMTICKGMVQFLPCSVIIKAFFIDIAYTHVAAAALTSLT